MDGDGCRFAAPDPPNTFGRAISLTRLLGCNIQVMIFF